MEGAPDKEAARRAVTAPLIPAMRGIEAIKLFARMRGLLFDASALPDGPGSIDRASLIELGQAGGLSLAARRCSLSALANAGLPAIGSVSPKAYFVIEAATRDSILIRTEGSVAPIRIDIRRLEQGWTGMVWIAGAAQPESGPPIPEPATATGRSGSSTSWIARWLAIGLFSAGVALAVWMGAAQIQTEVIATASVVPEPPPTSISAPASGVLRSFTLKDGDAVKAGDLIGEIEVAAPAGNNVDRPEHGEAALAVARANALLAAISQNAPPVLPEVPDLDSSRRAIEQQRLVARYNDYRGKLSPTDAELEQRRVERTAALELVARTTEALDAAQKETAASKLLLEQGFISRDSFVEKDVRRIELEREVARHQLFVAERTRALEAVQQRQRSTRAEFERALQVERDESAKLVEAMPKPVSLPARVVAIVAVGDGIARDVANARIGQPVEQGQPLSGITRPRGAFELDAILVERDALRVKPGQHGTAAVGGAPSTATALAVRVISVHEAEAGSPAIGRTTRVRLQADGPIATRTGSSDDPNAAWQIRIRTGSQMRFEQWIQRFKGR